MRNYNYETKWLSLLTPDIVRLLTKIHEYRGEQSLFIETHAEQLNDLMRVARIQSTDASNKIEGIYTSDERLKKIMMDKTTPETRNEKEIAGYRDVLNTIHQSFDFLSIKPSYILQLHRDLYKFTGEDIGGKFKAVDNVIAEVDESGAKNIRFQPVPAWETPSAMEELCRAYNEAISSLRIDPVLLMPMFVLDFLCIHPFSDGNGRMSRLLTLLILYKADYTVGKYISIEKIIERTKETYYEALKESSKNWHEEENDYEPFVYYMLGVIANAYEEFSSRVNHLISTDVSKPERIEALLKEHIGKITKTEIMEKCPDISQTTIQRTLNELLEQNKIRKIGGGRYTSYVWNEEGEMIWRK